MADNPIKVVPPALLEAASQAAAHVETAATPPRVVPVVSPASPADAAAAAIGAGMSARTAQMTATWAGKGPVFQALTESGVAEMQA